MGNRPTVVGAELVVLEVPAPRSRIRHALTGGPFTPCRFAGLDLRVGYGVFVPSSFSERLATTALGLVAGRRRPVVVDVGTGCGAVALAVAAARPDAEVHGTDLSVLAIRSARRNRRRSGLRRVRLHGGSLFDPLSPRLLGHVAVVVGNVPYVPPGMAHTGAGLMPRGTFEGTGEDGLGLVRDLADRARGVLEPGGWLVLQVADHQGDALAEDLARKGYWPALPFDRRPGRAIVLSALWPSGSEGDRRRPSGGDRGRQPESRSSAPNHRWTTKAPGRVPTHRETRDLPQEITTTTSMRSTHMDSKGGDRGDHAEQPMSASKGMVGGLGWFGNPRIPQGGAPVCCKGLRRHSCSAAD